MQGEHLQVALKPCVCVFVCGRNLSYNKLKSLPDSFGNLRVGDWL